MASQLQFGRQPTNTAKSATITPAVTARILDRFGNLTTSTTSVTIAIDNNPPSLLGLTAGTLNGTMTHRQSPAWPPSTTSGSTAAPSTSAAPGTATRSR